MTGLELWTKLGFCAHKYKPTGSQVQNTYEPGYANNNPYKIETLVVRMCITCGKVKIKKLKGAWELGGRNVDKTE